MLTRLLINFFNDEYNISDGVEYSADKIHEVASGIRTMADEIGGLSTSSKTSIESLIGQVEDSSLDLKEFSDNMGVYFKA